MIPKSRKEAMQAVVRRYNTGKPCPNGHTSDRETISGSCIQCAKEARERFSEAFKNKKKEG